MKEELIEKILEAAEDSEDLVDNRMSYKVFEYILSNILDGYNITEKNNEQKNK